MRTALLGLLAVGLVGCGDLNDAINSERKPLSPPGIAPVGEMDGMNVGRQANGNAADAGAGNRANAGANKSSIIGKTDAKVVDKKKAMADNPDLVIVENKIKGNDPFSVAGSAYVSMSSSISIRTFKHNLNIWKNLPENERRNPTYEEFIKMAKDLQFSRLYPYQMYGYDSDTGGIVVIEDKAEKKRRYEALGIAPDE